MTSRVGEHRIPRSIGEEHREAIGGVHPSPVKIWADRGWTA
jgi:hypothetical protein